MSRLIDLNLKGGKRIVDLFAGGGGASTALEAATGRAVAVAINHDPVAITVHAANHPMTTHFRTNVWEVDPKKATKGKPVGILWASPDCKHFSNAKGDVPRDAGIRSLAWVVVDWARQTKPDVIFMENVREFLTWGPLDDEGYPIEERAGETFAEWKRGLEVAGYELEWRLLNAADYGAPTARRRFFMVARRDGLPIRWPTKTHGSPKECAADPSLKPYRTAAECIDWSLPVHSIFLSNEEGRAVGVKRPLAANTLARIARGIQRFVLDNPTPFIVPGAGGQLTAPTIVTIDQKGQKNGTQAVDAPLGTVVTKARHVVVAPTLVQTGYGERPGQRPRFLDLHEPLGTVVAGGSKHALVATFLARHFGGRGTPGSSLDEPVRTVTTKDHHALVNAQLEHECGDDCPCVSEPQEHYHPDRRQQVAAFLMNYNGTGQDWSSAAAPMRTVTTKARMGLVTVTLGGVPYTVVDVGMRMLEPHELLRAQFGRFAEGYDLSAARSKEDQVRLIGNSVAPECAEALVRANL